MILTQELLELLNKSNGRIVNVASKSHTRCVYSADLIKNTWEKEGWNYYKNSYGYYNQYAYSKLGNVFFNQHLYERIKKDNLNVTTVALHPGVIPTEIARDCKLRFVFYIIYPFFWLLTKTTFRGAQTTLHCCFADEKDLENGGYYKDCGVTPVHPHADYKETENRLAYINWSKMIIEKNGVKAGVEFRI